MANILDKYGIKEVADVTFYKLTENADGSVVPGAPVLYLDTLKVSTIEQTAENVSARGGKGNPELITWDYNKEITVTLEDALFSAKSLAMMYGALDTDGKLDATGKETTTVIKTFTPQEVTLIDTTTGTIKKNGLEMTLTNITAYTIDGVSTAITDTNVVPTEAVYLTGTLSIDDTSKTVININADTFPKAYYITGDTYARSNSDNEDEFFQFIIPKAKVTSEVTLTMEAEGDPSTFNMTLKVLRPKSGPMMKLVKYDLKAKG